MGFIGRLLSFTRVVKDSVKLSDVKLDPDGGSNITGEHYADPGDDSFPLSADYVAAMAVRRNGGSVVVGYADSVNDPKAAEGEKRIYGRDPATGLSVNEIWLKADGAVLIANANGSFELMANGSIKGLNSLGSFELESGGNFVVNGVTIDPAGNIITPTTITAAIVAASSNLTVASKEMGGHTHAQGVDSDGDTQVNTGGPV